MKPQISVITLGVDDLDRSLRFYRDGLGLPTKGIIGTQFKGNDTSPAGAVALFELRSGPLLCLYPRSELAKDAHLKAGAPSATEFSIGQLVRSRDEVDTMLEAAAAAGAVIPEQAHERPWGIYSGYFQDPDGHLWEIIWNPAMPG